MTRSLPAAVALMLPLALPLAAQEISGAVDGDPRTWHVGQVDGAPSAGWYDHGMMAQVEIFGFPGAGAGGDVFGALEISLSLMSDTVVGVSVVYYADGTRQLYTTDDEDSVQLTLAEVRSEGDTLHLRGSLEAELFRMESLFSEELDRDDSRTVAASFEMALEAR